MQPATPISPDDYVRLGRTELRVSPICFGTWQLSPRFWGEVPAEDILQAIPRAVELGVNFIDTADAYGNGFSEEVVGQALAKFEREKIVVATKACWRFRDDGSRYADLSGNYLIEACEASLRRLGTDYIDLYQCHSYDPLVPPEESIAALDKLKQQGKIRHYGISNWTSRQIELGLALGGQFATCQPFYSLIKRDAEQDLLPLCLARDIGVLVYSPLHHGLLTGKYRGDESFDDFRNDHPDFQQERFQNLCGRVGAMAEIGKAHDLSAIQAALVTTLMHPAIQVAIVGIKKTEHIEEAVGAAGKQLEREVTCQLRAAIDG
jgi:hypothetical protein